MADVTIPSVKLSLANVAVTGVIIEYGINSIPTASVSVDPNAGAALICDPESNKRKPVTVDISTVNGCLKFEGLFDGVAVSQTPGALSYNIILKSKFQRLLELYPRIPGLTPGSADVLKRTEAIVTAGKGGNDVFARILTGTSSIELNRNVFLVLKDLLKKIIELQAQPGASHVDINLSSLPRILDNPAYANALAAATELIEGIDVTAVQDSGITGSQSNLGMEITEWFVNGPETILEALMYGITQLGCSVIVGNSKIFVVPTNDYLRIDHPTPGFRQESTTINTAFPADYNNFNFGNDSYRDIGHCWVLADLSSMYGVEAPNYVELGYFSDPTAKASGLHVEKLPSGFFLPATRPETTNAERRDDVEQQLTNIKGKTEADEAKADHTAATVDIKTATEDMKQRFGDNLAEIKYYQAKFTGRSGSFNMQFNPNWVPGTTGTLYIKYPGIFVDFYVTNVTHRISIDAPSNGTASTSISFMSGRLGAGTPPGVDTDKFYNYTKEKMIALQKKFVIDTTS